MNANCDNEIPLAGSQDALDALRQLNASLRAALIHMRPEQNHCSTITAQHFSDLRSHIRRGAELVSGLSADSATSTRKETSAYRGHLESLRQFLPDLQGRLLAEKSRLEEARNQAAAADAWVHASRITT